MTVTVDAELANRHKEPNDGYKKYLGAKVEHMQSVLDREKRKFSFGVNVCIMLD